ncbi:MAG: hypothetical protein KF682_17005, partial [Nitrospira sp.]|nr:hypothetical protein [Nitrospira sp.]
MIRRSYEGTVRELFLSALWYALRSCIGVLIDRPPKEDNLERRGGLCLYPEFERGFLPPASPRCSSIFLL